MNISQEEFSSRIYDLIRDKIFLSNISGMPVTVVKKLPEQIKPGKVLFDGLNLFDGIEGIEDDIQQMTTFTKDSESFNLEDYYTDNSAFDDDGWDRFLVALERLMTIDEFIHNRVNNKKDMKKFDDYFDFIEAVTTAISNNDDVYIFNNADGYYFDEESNKSKDFFTDKMFDMRALQMNLFERYLDGEFPDNEKKLHIVLDYVHDENDAINPIYDRLFIFR